MKTCSICGYALRDEEGRHTSRSKTSNMILLMSLSLAGQKDSESARLLAESITKPNRKVCHTHVIRAAQYLLAEMAMKGKRISRFEDPSAGGRTAFVTNADVSSDLLDILNIMAQGSVHITGLDVSKFLNDALARYYSTSMWPVTEEVNVVTHDVAEDAAKAPIIGEVDGEGSDLKVLQAVEGDLASTSCPSEVSAKEAERSLDTSEDESKCSSTSSSFFKPLLRKTKPEALDRYFLVKGFQLMQLFQFCPQCGHRLSETELVGKGTAAIVKYVCKGCNFGAQCVKQWESQELQSPS